MHKYLQDTAFAVREIIKMVTFAQTAIADIQTQLTAKRQALLFRKELFSYQDSVEDYDDIRLQHTSNMMGRVAKDIEELKVQEQLFVRPLTNKDISIKALSGSR